MSTRTGSILAATFAGLFLAVGAGPTAQAAEGGSEALTVQTIQAPLKLDCATLTDAGRAYAVENNIDLCGILSSSRGGNGVHALDQVSDDCGESHIYMYQGSESGKAFVTWGFTSTDGAALRWDLLVTYDGPDNSGTLSDSGWFSDVAHEQSEEVFTGRGRASASLSGTIETWLGSCFVEEPASSASIG